MLNNKKNSGFTLIEIMIAITIIAILSAIAYPNYSEYVNRSRRADGQEALMSAMQKQEVFYANNAIYATNNAALGITGTSEDGFYAITFNNPCDAIVCTMTATPLGVQLVDKVNSFTLSSRGLKTSVYEGSNMNTWTDY